MSLTAVIAYSALLLVGGVFSTVSGGGLGILTIVLGTFFLDPRLSIIFASVLLLSIQIAKVWHFRRFVRWDIAKWYILSGIPMSYLGGVLLFTVPPRIPAVLLGITCIGFVAMRFWKFAPRLDASKATLILSGGVNGFIGGFVGNAALIRMPALLSMGLSKEVFVGTSAVIGLLMNLAKVTAYVPNIPFTRNVILLLVISTPIVLLSVKIGKWLLRYVSVALFEDLQLIVILMGAIKLLLFP